MSTVDQITASVNAKLRPAAILNMNQWQAKKAVASRTAAAKECRNPLQRRIWNVEPFCTVCEWR